LILNKCQNLSITKLSKTETELNFIGLSEEYVYLSNSEPNNSKLSNKSAGIFAMQEIKYEPKPERA
jgi:hypothetical protein